MTEPSFEPRVFREAMGCYATGVTIITSVGWRKDLIGITANSFSSVSLEPPLVLFSLSRSAYSWRSFLSTHNFAVNILSRTQRALAERFAKAGEDKWRGVDYGVWDTGCPILPGALASFECEYRYTHDGGDHVIFVGEVLRMECNTGREPLVFYQGGYADLNRAAD